MIDENGELQKNIHRPGLQSSMAGKRWRRLIGTALDILREAV